MTSVDINDGTKRLLFGKLQNDADYQEFVKEICKSGLERLDAATGPTAIGRFIESDLEKLFEISRKVLMK